MLLSVVIPTFRKPELLERTLGALARQVLEPGTSWEVVVVDDGSGDNRTSAVLDRARAVLDLVEAGCGRNEGRARARNRGWRAASGRWVLFLDDDIVLREGALAAHVAAQFRREAAHLGSVVTAPEIVDSALFDYLDTRGIAKCEGEAEVPARYFLTQNVSVPRAALAAVGGFDEGFGAYGFEDMEIAFRLEERAGIHFFALPAAVGEHVHHHTLDEYLRKKQICGEQTLRQLARLHPGRLAEMRLDVLPGLGAGATPSRRLLGTALSLSWRLGAHRWARVLVERAGGRIPRSASHRILDYLVLSAYAAGLRGASSAATVAGHLP